MSFQRPADSLARSFMKRKGQSQDQAHGKSLFNLLPNRVRNHFVAMLGEFVGTFLFLFFAFSATQVANSGPGGEASPQTPDTSVLLYISLAFGFSLAVNVWTFFRISGGLFNPAVTFGMCLVGALNWFRCFLLIFTQLIGAIAAAAVVMVLFPGELKVRTTLTSGTSIQQGIFIEMFLTAQLVFTIFMLAAEKHKGTYLAPVGIGLSLFIAELAGVFYTGGSLNPARSFGPDVVLATFDGFHYVYWVGPFLGSLVAVVFYKLIKALEYETANPGQDQNEKEARMYKPQTEYDPNSPDPPGVERINSRQSQHGRSGRHMQGAKYSRDGQNESTVGNNSGTASAQAQRQYYSGPIAERGEMPHNHP